MIDRGCRALGFAVWTIQTLKGRIGLLAFMVPTNMDPQKWSVKTTVLFKKSSVGVLFP